MDKVLKVIWRFLLDPLGVPPLPKAKLIDRKVRDKEKCGRLMVLPEGAGRERVNVGCAGKQGGIRRCVRGRRDAVSGKHS